MAPLSAGRGSGGRCHRVGIPAGADIRSHATSGCLRAQRGARALLSLSRLRRRGARALPLAAGRRAGPGEPALGRRGRQKPEINATGYFRTPIERGVTVVASRWDPEEALDDFEDSLRASRGAAHFDGSLASDALLAQALRPLYGAEQRKRLVQLLARANGDSGTRVPLLLMVCRAGEPLRPCCPDTSLRPDESQGDPRGRPQAEAGRRPAQLELGCPGSARRKTGGSCSSSGCPAAAEATSRRHTGAGKTRAC
jgi:hypothetical protein